MKLFTLIAIAVAPVFSFAQNNIQQAINDQVWKPFIQNFSARNTDGFMAVHSQDLVRVPRDSKRVIDFNTYKKQSQAGSDKQSKRTIELRFLERIASETQACEVGIYKTSVTSPQGEIKSHYGKFLVILRKENDTWKILADTDSSEGNTIDEKDFLDAQPMQ